MHDPAITAQGSAFRHKVRVDIHFRDGTVESETREAPRGSEQSFASADDIVEKFRKLTRAVMAEKQQDALVDAVLGLEKLPDSRKLIELLRLFVARMSVAISGAAVPHVAALMRATSYIGFSPRTVTRRIRRRSSGLKSVRACSAQRLSHISRSPGRQTCS